MKKESKEREKKLKTKTLEKWQKISKGLLREFSAATVTCGYCELYHKNCSNCELLLSRTCKSILGGKARYTSFTRHLIEAINESIEIAEDIEKDIKGKLIKKRKK